MDEPFQRFPNGDRKFTSHIELEKQGWHRGDHPNRKCRDCGDMCEWWGKGPTESRKWELFNVRTTTMHKETCSARPSR